MYPAHDNHKMIINGNVKSEPVETKEMTAAKKKEFTLVFEKGQYTIDQKIKVRICKSQLVNNRDFFCSYYQT